LIQNRLTTCKPNLHSGIWGKTWQVAQSLNYEAKSNILHTRVFSRIKRRSDEKGHSVLQSIKQLQTDIAVVFPIINLSEKHQCDK
jgi:hypothetical protein